MTNSLRPTNFDDVVGQKSVIKLLKIAVKAANIKGDALPHTLLDGPPGLGKTTLCLTLAGELKTEIQVANGANLRSLKSLLPFLTKITPNSILFIDEIHRVTRIVEEFLYPAMEDYKVTLGQNENVVNIDLPKFTLVGATTNTGLLSTPFLDRFVYKCHLRHYSTEEIVKLLKKNIEKLNSDVNFGMPDNCIQLLAERSRGTPRKANNLLTWVQAFQSAEQVSLDVDVVNKALECLEIDRDGLDPQDRQYLHTLKIHYPDPVGLKTLASLTNIAPETIEYVVEPYLLTKGLIKKVSKGRVLVRYNLS